MLNVDPNGPASRAGLQAGDVIVAAAGRVTMTVDDLTRIVSIAPTGEPLELSIIRHECLRELTIAP